MESKSVNFFKVIAQGQTYLNMLYLLLFFPLGIFYFIFLITGLSVGLGLIITLLGAPILLGVLLLWRVFAIFERQKAVIMLDIDIPYTPLEQPVGFWKKIQAYFNDTFTWKALAYLFLSFPLGIFTFVVLTTLIAISISFVAYPFIFHLWQIGIISGDVTVGTFAFTNTYWFSIILGIVGAFMCFVSLHAFNGLAHMFGLLTKALLGRRN